MVVVDVYSVFVLFLFCCLISSLTAWGACATVFLGLIFFSDWDAEVQRAQNQVKLGLLSRDTDREETLENSTDEEMLNQQL